MMRVLLLTMVVIAVAMGALDSASGRVVGTRSPVSSMLRTSSGP